MTFTLFSGTPGQSPLPANPQSEPFELVAIPGPDIWRTPSCAGGRDDFTGPTYATPLPLASFKSAKVTISSDFPGNYSQGGLILFMPETIPITQNGLEESPRIWIKAGIEKVDGEIFASVAAAKPYSDWSLVRLEDSWATFEMEKVKGSLWIYVTGRDGRRRPVRKLTWVVDVAPENDIWIGVAACMPKGDETESGGVLKVQFRDFSITTE
jgi:regulation of enolase protein 1 (concanavalin A-like superfamily)